VENLLNSDQVAEKMGMSKIWVYKQAEKGLLPFYRIGEALRFNPEEVEQYLRSRKGIKRVYGESRNPKLRKKKDNHLVAEQEG
jgi:excisionase family DNA binding protein